VPASEPVPRKPEILAPAGDAESLAAALACGADAVYFGLDDGFNARARATNFSLAGLPKTCAQIHRAGAKAYLTLNTLLFESELASLEAMLRQIAEAGVDALIVQDPAVALLARAVAPTLEVHGSTQMTISSAEAAAFAEGLGCTRVVVPRELSVQEIRQFKGGTGIELEVFVHGALCMSWSGQCLTSEAWGGRSANRGQCAQSCRMPYDLVVDGEVRDLGEVQYLLSPQDLSGVRAIPDLCAIGVASLKIEGRQKGPQYVATAVQTYRRWLDAQGNVGQVPLQRLSEDVARMALSYSRGLSDGFLGGADHQALVEGRFPKHRGVLLGTVVEVQARAVRVVHGDRQSTGGLALHDGLPAIGEVSSPLPQVGEIARVEPRPGMGIVIDGGHPEDKHEPGGPLFRVEATRDGWLLGFGTPGPDLRKAAIGHKVWLTSDPRIAQDTDRLLQQGEPEGRIAATLRVDGADGQPLRAILRSARAEVSGQTEVLLQPAAGAGLDEALVRDKLGALGGTPFVLHDLQWHLAAGLHVPVSALKALRRQLTQALLPLHEAAYVHAIDPRPALPRLLHQDPTNLSGPVQLRALCRNDAQLDAVIASGLPEVELDWMELIGLTRAVDKARAAGLKVTIATVRVQKPGEDGFDRRIARLQPDGVLVRHWGGLMHFRGLDPSQRPAIHGDFSLNVTNSVTAHHLLGLGADTLTAAHDLDETQLHALLDRVPAHRMAVTVHHHIPTFHTEHCVYAHLLSHGRDFKTCGRPCEAHEVALRDHLGQAHPVVVDVGCRNTVFNAQAQSAAESVARLIQRGVQQFRVEFVRETRAQAEVVLGAWQDLLAGRCTPAELHAKVGVHEQFGVTRGTMRTWAG
jgi:putative protease